MFIRLLITLLLASLSAVSLSAPLISLIDDKNTRINVGRTGSYYIDSTGSLTLSQLQSDRFSRQFLPLEQDFLQFGLVEGNIWIRLDIANRLSNAMPVVLEVNAPRLQFLDFYVPHISQLQPLAELGEARPYSNRLINHPHYLMAIPADTQAVTTVYIRLASHLPINMRASLISASEMSNGYQWNFSFTGLLLGIILVLLISNVFFFMKTRQPMYFLYGLLLLGIVTLHLALHGQLYQFFPHYVGLQERIYNFSALFCAMAITFFSRYYLDTPRYFPQLDKGLIGLGVVNGLLAMGYALSPERLNIIYLSATAVFTLLSLLGLGLLACFRRVPYSGYYLIARLVLFTGHGTWIMTVYGALPSAMFYEWGLTLSIIVEAMIHFTGMIARLNPFGKHHTIQRGYSKSEIFDLLTDLASRMRRQINVILGSLGQMRSPLPEEKITQMREGALLAGKNLNELVVRLDNLNHIRDRVFTDQDNPTLLTDVMESAQEEFHSLDQDNATIEVLSEELDGVELLENHLMIQHLLTSLMLEFKHFGEQELIIETGLKEQQRDGVSFFTLAVYPLPSRSSVSQDNSFNLGLGYIAILVEALQGELQVATGNKGRQLNIQLPINYHVLSPQSRPIPLTPCQLLVVGSESLACQRLFSLSQSWPISIVQLKNISELIATLPTQNDKELVNLVVLFENEGYIPHLAVRQIKSRLQMGDQCLLISNNVKMPRDYALSLGFDDLLQEPELEDQLKPLISRLTTKGLRLKNVSVSQVKSPTGST